MGSTLIIFGASGDLARRKLIPALYALHAKQRLPGQTRIVGMSRSDYSSAQWRRMLAESTAEYASDLFTAATWEELAPQIHYCPGDAAQADDLRRLAQFLQEIEEPGATRLFYLATKPELYAPVVAQLGAAGLTRQAEHPPRIVVEKPFGSSLATAHALNACLHQVFNEDQVFRIDHYLGKETVQNLLVLRFANSIFEPLWNRNYVDHVQITVAEEVTVGNRGEYYDTSGVLRDMFQNHLLQLMMIAAMEMPGRYQPEFVRDEKVKVLQAVRPLKGSDFATDTVRGQYAGYLSEKGVAPQSETATFAALKLHVDNWRWQGVPFYLRSGKAMSCRTTQLVIQFREPPHTLFNDSATGKFEGNRLVIQVQPAEGIQLHLQTKVPDAGMRIRETDMDFRFAEVAATMPDAYQRLLLDAFVGDPGLFARSDEVELAWTIMDPILRAWDSPAAPPLEAYPPGDWGPASSQAWMHNQHRNWFDVCPVLQ